MDSSSSCNSIFTNPSIRDQAIRQGYFAKISQSDLMNPLFTEYDIRFTEIGSNCHIFDGLYTDSIWYANADFHNTVCKISYSAICKLVPSQLLSDYLKEDDQPDNTYYLVDESYKTPKKLIKIWIDQINGSDGKPTDKYLMKYLICPQLNTSHPIPTSAKLLDNTHLK